MAIDDLFAGYPSYNHGAYQSWRAKRDETSLEARLMLTGKSAQKGTATLNSKSCKTQTKATKALPPNPPIPLSLQFMYVILQIVHYFSPHMFPL